MTTAERLARVLKYALIMTHSKFFSVPNLMLILTALWLAGCGSGTTGTTTTASDTSTTSTASTSSSSSLALSASASTVLKGGTVTFTASGGSSSYTYYCESTGLGSISSSTGVFTASSSETGTATIEVEDSDGNLATKTVEVISTLVITPSESSIAAGGTVTFTVSGGTAPYEYLLPVGDGSLSNSGSSSATSTVYTSSSLDSTDIELEVIDSSATPQIIYSTVTISSSTSGGSTSSTSSGFTSYISLLTDDMLGITFYNTSSLTNPELVFFGTGSKPTEVTMFAHTAVSSCGHDSSGNTSSPCTQSVSLTNYTNGSDYSVTYEGTINFVGRSGAGYVSFCIPPTDTTAASAYVLAGSLSGSATKTEFLTMVYNDSKDGRAFMSGAQATSFYAETDTNGGVGDITIWISGGGFTSNTSCSSSYSSTVTVN